MTNKPPRAGGETDSWCTKCQLLLNHRIVAVDKGRPVKVECLTCRTVHMYRPNAPGAAAARPASASASAGVTRSASPSSAPRAARGAAAARAEQAEKDRVHSWEKAIAGRAVADFRAYRVSEAFKEGDLVRHSRFGDGVVVRIIDARKIEILFKDESKTLAQNMTD